jgi:hypothetical protein
MIRRNVLSQADHTIRWSLIAAAFALSLGFYAQHALATQQDASSTVVVEQEATATVSDNSAS